MYVCVFEREAQRDGVPIDWEGDRETIIHGTSPPIGQNVSEVFTSWKCMHLGVLFREVVSLVQGCSGLHRGSNAYVHNICTIYTLP